MKAMILAAGRGSRMRPLTDHTPKPLLSVGGKPLIVWHIENLKRAGFSDIVINIAWLGYKIPEALGDGSDFGVSLHYSDEQEKGALETAGGIIKALPLLITHKNDDEPFFVVSGDVWCDLEFKHITPPQSEDLAHLVMVNNPAHNPTGDFSLNGNRLKDSGDTKFTFSGIGYYRPTLFKNRQTGKRKLATLLREKMHDDQISGEHFTGDWRDIGTPERLNTLDMELQNA